MGIWIDGGQAMGPVLTDEMIQAAEITLGFQLPRSYVEVLRERNGGTPARRCFRTSERTSWADDHIEISGILGIGFEGGLDGKFGSQYMIMEWGYPDIGVVICDTPSAGHDTVMLDYRECGMNGEPCVVYIDEDRTILPLAQDFAAFLHGLVDCDALRG